MEDDKNKDKNPKKMPSEGIGAPAGAIIASEADEDGRERSVSEEDGSEDLFCLKLSIKSCRIIAAASASISPLP